MKTTTAATKKVSLFRRPCSWRRRRSRQRRRSKGEGGDSGKCPLPFGHTQAEIRAQKGEKVSQGFLHFLSKNYFQLTFTLIAPEAVCSPFRGPELPKRRENLRVGPSKSITFFLKQFYFYGKSAKGQRFVLFGQTDLFSKHFCLKLKQK